MSICVWDAPVGVARSIEDAGVPVMRKTESHCCCSSTIATSRWRNDASFRCERPEGWWVASEVVIKVTARERARSECDGHFPYIRLPRMGKWSIELTSVLGLG